MTNEATERKPRSPSKPKIIRVADESGHGAYYYDTSTASAKAKHCAGITARDATDLEIMHIARRGIVVVGLVDGDEDDGPQNRLDIDPPTRED